MKKNIYNINRSFLRFALLTTLIKSLAKSCLFSSATLHYFLTFLEALGSDKNIPESVVSFSSCGISIPVSIVFALARHPWQQKARSLQQKKKKKLNKNRKEV